MDNQAFQTDDDRRHQSPYIINNNRYQPRPFNNDNLVEVNSRAKLLKNPTFFKKLSIFFVILAILFFIVMVIFIFLYSKYKPKICTSQECLRTASNFLSSINYSVDPCDNFYKFVCGKWSEEHPNHGWWNSFSSFTTITEKIAIASMNILSEDIDIDNDPEALKKSKDFYESCIDVDTIDDLGIATMYPFLVKMNLPIIPNFMTAKDKSKIQFNWMLTDALAKQILLMDIFIGVAVGPNIFNGSQNVLYIGQIYQTSPLPSPFKKTRKRIVRQDGNKDKTAAKQLARTANVNIITNLMNEIILNETGQVAAEDLLEEAANVIIEISDYMDEIVTNTTDPDQQEDDTYALTVDNLQHEIDDYIKTPNPAFLTTYLSYLFNNTNITIDTKSDLLFVTKLDVLFMKMIIDYLSELPDVNIELYMWWSSVYAMIFNTSSDIAEYITKQLNLFSGNTDSLVRSRSLECTLLINNYMGYATSYALADRSFQNVTKPKVENMIYEIKNAFLSSVKDLTWIDAKTKSAILEKAEEMITFIGYPNWLFEKGKLDKYYKEIIIKPDTYLENMVNVIVAHTKENLNSLRKKHKRDWYSEPIEVNAFNSFSDNAINVPMAILNFPVYHLGLEALNYGSIGSILGHELIHGFDNLGRKHDKYGNFMQWWTNQTIESFENLTDCFVKQYENFTIPGVEGHVNGKSTLSENIADNGGLNQAFKAYTNYLNKYGEDLKLPGFENYNNHQLFFIAYTSVWCETTSAKDLEDQFKYDEHCPNLIRVLGTLQNSDDFANKFECPKGSPMNPMKKCKIW
ncbi:unnamed protein product [Psylliodes chrysocephalus]|uniref:Endothelin-converting enzyme 1 n=1 Tax=Psylliodes chrysocephalus TaxID=3402493 RepID=A0A9P0CQD3_9CUCU|nr:unnamed protein product [Psylliodes chrysocephala]